MAGTMIRRGQAQQLYDDHAQSLVQKELFPEAFAARGLLPYNHPPFEALPFAAIARLSYARAYSLVIGLNVFVLIMCVHVLKHWLPALNSIVPRFLYLVPFAFYPVAYALVQGQDSVLLLILYSLAYVSLRQGKKLRAGIFLGLGLFKFHLVLPFIFILLLRRCWPALKGVLISATVAFAVSWAIVGIKALVSYPSYLLHVNRWQSSGVVIVPSNMPNLRGLFMLWGKQSLPVEIGLMTASVGILVWAAYRWRVDDLRDLNVWNAGFSLAMVAGFLAGFHSYSHDMSIFLLPGLLGIDCVLERCLPKHVFALKSILVLMFFSPLHFLLTLYASREALFALVLLAWVYFLADSCRSAPRLDARMAEAASRAS